MNDGYDVEESKYAWIEEIAMHMPNFKRLEVTEHFTHPDSQIYKRFLWSDLPGRLRTALDQAGISTHFLLWQPIIQ